MVSRKAYEKAKARVEASKTYWAGRRSLSTEESRRDPSSNEDRSLVEVYEFEHMDAGKDGYMAYWKDGRVIVNWMGAVLAEILHQGGSYRSPAFGGRGSERVNFRALGIDGHTYSGTYYKSSGDYVRMKRVKGGR